MKYGSLFSGIGGFDLGLDRAGMTCAWQVEKDGHCREILTRHWPDVLKYKDVKDVGKHNLESVDLICGGFPCQDVSVAGGRAGLAGKRSGLWFEFHRIIDELKPEWVVIENVPGLLSSNEGRDFAAILRGLVECGYGVAWRILDSQYFGVPQRRRRVFIVGHLGTGRAAQVLFERESSAGDTPPSREAGKGAAAPLTSRFAGGSNQWAPMNEADNLQVTTAFNGYTGGADDNDAQGGHLVAFGGNNTAGEIDVATAVNAHGSRRYDFESETFVAFTERTRGGRRQVEWQENIAYALDNPGAGGRTQTRNVASTFGVRRLTPVECERLQGFPDGWTAGQSDSQRYRQMGNAVTVPVIEWLGRQMLTASPPPRRTTPPTAISQVQDR